MDIPNVFRDFDADPDDPASNDFTWTDADHQSGQCQSGTVYVDRGTASERMEPQTCFARDGVGVSYRRTAGFILAMQRSKVDIGMFYDGRCATGKHGGLFNPMTLQPLKSAKKNESEKSLDTFQPPAVPPHRVCCLHRSFTRLCQGECDLMVKNYHIFSLFP